MDQIAMADRHSGLQREHNAWFFEACFDSGKFCLDVYATI